MMPDTATCAGCQIAYPEGLLFPYVTDGIRYESLCGICALALLNSTHGTRYRTFESELAEAKRQQALAYRWRLHCQKELE